MGALFAVETTDGKKKLDLAEASRMVVMVGGIEYTILPPNIAPLLRSSLAEGVLEQSRQRIANADRIATASSRRFMEKMNPPDQIQ